MRELTDLEIEQLDMTGRIPELNGDDYQLIGLIAENPSKQTQGRKGIRAEKRSIGKQGFARSA